MKHLTLDDIKIPKPDFLASKLPKSEIISKWLIDWIEYSLERGIADIGDFIPKKEELASFLDVSVATVQNSIREVKNLGYFTSKQSLGTCISDFESKNLENEDSLNHSSIAICKIKKIILDEKIELNSPILSVSELSQKTDISKNTIRFSLNFLVQEGFLEKIKSKGNKHIFIYKKQFELSKDEITHGLNNENFTLTNRLVEKIKCYIEKTYKPKEKILPNQALANMFDVSIKTINDAMKVLNNKKIILSRRGKYGTIYLGQENQDGIIPNKTQFLSSERKKLNSKTYSYFWQKALGHLKKYIVENYEAGDKIAPIRELASILNVSPNTIRRALSDMFQKGFLVSKRGKSGGIFILEMPVLDEESYRWLAINPKNFEN